MDDQFFTKLREIQKKERANSSLARVGNDFYKRTHKYLDSIRDVAVNDPFSEESDLLKNVQRIATEICEIREHKISDAAVMNIHRSYHLFQGKPQFDLVDTTPLNITEEEETLYFSFLDVLKNHRRGISLDQLTTNDESSETTNNSINNVITNSDSGISDPINNSRNNSTTPTSSTAPTNSATPTSSTTPTNSTSSINSNNATDSTNSENSFNNSANVSDSDKIVENNVENDKVLNRLNEIKSSKVIKDGPRESIEKQIISSKYSEKDHNQRSQSEIAEDLKNNSSANTNSSVKDNNTNIIDNGDNNTSMANDTNNINNPNKTNGIDTNTNTNNTNNVLVNDVSTNISNNDVTNQNSVANNSDLGNNATKSKSELSNIIGNEDEQFIDLDNLEHDLDLHNLDHNANIRTNSKSTVDRIANVMVLIFSEINSIIGVDEKIYGPFQPQDIVIMPDINAEILIKNKKGRIVKV